MSAIRLIVYISFVNGSTPHNGSKPHNGNNPHNGSKPDFGGKLTSTPVESVYGFDNFGDNWKGQEMTNILSVGYIFDENELAELYGTSKISLIHF